MESLSTYMSFWLIYLASGLLGYWCWGRMFSWMKRRGLAYHLVSAAGAVLIFTPVPVAPESPAFLAPGFVVVGFGLLSGELASMGYLGLWFGASAVMAFGITFIMSLAGLLPVGDWSPASANATEPAPRKAPVRRDNPFR